MTYQSRRPQQVFLCISCCLLFFATVGRASSSLQHNQLPDTQLQVSLICRQVLPAARFLLVSLASPKHHTHCISHCCLQAFTKVATLAPSAYPDLNRTTNTFPANVSGTYKGTWHLSAPDAGASPLPVLKQGSGTIAFQLETTLSGTEEVLNVQVRVLLLH